MERHLTEQELIAYRFGLASAEQARCGGEHLARCAECRGRLEQLDRKFASLDLLREDVHASEELISQVLAQVKQPATPKVVPLFRRSWFSAVAAVLVVGFAVLIGSLTQERASKQEFAKDMQSQPAVLDRQSSAQPQVEEGVKSLVAKEPDTAGASHPMGEPAGLRGRDALGTRGQDARDTEIAEQPPFAPASAIELVTLPRREGVQLTIYNSADLTLVRERRNLTLKKGWNWLQFMWANTLIDPTSLSLEPLERRGEIDVQQLVFPARLRELGRWLIHSQISGRVPFEITYFTSGLSWRAFYMGTLSRDEKTMKLEGYVCVDNTSGEDYENAQTRLIVGQVHILDGIAQLASRQYPYDRPAATIEGEKLNEKGAEVTNGDWKFYAGAYGGGLMGGMGPKDIVKEGLSEYFLYTIEGTETIPDQWGKRLLSFETEDIKVESLYKYDEERWGDETICFVKFANDDDHNLGRTPIPDGDVKIFALADEEGHLSYVGGTSVKYIPVNEEVELDLGAARLVKVEPKLMDYKTESYTFDTNGNISGWDEIRTWTVEIVNTRKLPIEVEITRGFDTPYWTIQADVPYEKYDATHARFRLQLEPAGKRSVDYIVRTCHGTREETMMRRQ